MPPPNLQIGMADRARLQVAFRRVAAQQLQTGAWLGARNWYLRKTKTRTDAGLAHQRERQLADYIAASVLLHAVDSARYLGRSLYCKAINDTHAVRHFAYYAELRAAMSILASEGIGVFNKWHYAVKSDGALARTSNISTHQYAWAALSAWSRDQRAADLIARIAGPIGGRLDTLLQTAFPGMGLGSIAASWFETWGLDLAILADEQTWRNLSSYRPTMLLSEIDRSPTEVVRELVDFWKAFEPSAASRFGALDNQLLRLAFEQQAKAAGVPKRSRRYRHVAQAVASAGWAGHQEAWFFEFLTRTNPATSADLHLISAAREKPQQRREYVSNYSMICRAAILLRIALGSAALLVADSGTPAATLRSWLDNLAIRSAIPAMPVNGSDVVDELWDGIMGAVDVFGQLDPPLPSFADMIARAAEPIILVGQCERIAIWSLTG